jgi:hypothetical protein
MEVLAHPSECNLTKQRIRLGPRAAIPRSQQEQLKVNNFSLLIAFSTSDTAALSIKTHANLFDHFRPN